jgi:HIV Tat-specific factor 1
MADNISAMAESIGGQASTTDVDDDYLRWQEEIQLAEEEAEALKAGRTHRYHKDFRKHVEFVEESIEPAPAVEVEDEERPATPPEGEQEFTDDDGTVYKWDRGLNSWVPQVS